MPRGRPRGSKNKPKPAVDTSGAEEAPELEVNSEPEEGENENEDNGEDNGEELSDEDKVELFENYRTARSELAELKEAIEMAEQEVQKAIAEIAHKVGTGPFEWEGEVIYIHSRKVRGRDAKYHEFRKFESSVQKIG